VKPRKRCDMRPIDYSRDAEDFHSLKKGSRGMRGPRRRAGVLVAPQVCGNIFLTFPNSLLPSISPVKYCDARRH